MASLYSTRKNIPDTIVHAFADVLGKHDVRAAQKVMDRISEPGCQAHYLLKSPITGIKAHFFLNEVVTLQAFERKVHVNGRSTAYSKGVEINTLEATTEGGTYGQIYLSADGKRIYKSITLTPWSRNATARSEWFEEKIREIYLETFVQVVLSQDPDVGHFICKPTRLFRDPTFVRRASGVLPDTLILYILMEPIKYTFESLVAKHGGVQMTWFGPLMYQLGNVLDVLKTKYDFSHRDLHSSNVLIAEEPDGSESIRLIDFGMSCLTYKGVVYRIIEEGDCEKGCDAGFDLAIFFTNLWFTFKDYITDPAVLELLSDTNFMGKLVRRPAGMFAIASEEESPTQEHWSFYSHLMTPEIRAFLATIDILNPRVLRDKMAEWNTARAPVAGGRMLRLKNRNRNRTMRMRTRTRNARSRRT